MQFDSKLFLISNFYVSDTTLKWTKNGVILSPTTKYRFDSTRKRITIVEPEKTDQGEYTCESSYLTHRVSGSGQLIVVGMLHLHLYHFFFKYVFLVSV